MWALLYRAALYLYPPSFWRRHGWKMRQDFRQMRDEGHPLSPLFWDILQTAPREWADLVRRAGAPRAASRGARFAESVSEGLREVRWATRGLLRRPGFTVVVVLTLGVGIGASTTVFSWTEGLVLRPLPLVESPSELLTIEVTDPQRTDVGGVMSYPDFVDLSTAIRPGMPLAGFSFSEFRVSSTNDASAGRSEGVWGAFVTEAYFSALGVQPVLGGFLSPTGQDHAAAPVVPAVISEALWSRRFGRDPGTLGRVISVEEEDFQVVGVAPERFTGTTVGLRLDLWLPVEAASDIRDDSRYLEDRTVRWLRIFGRIEPEMTLDAARVEFGRYWDDVRAEYPESRDLEIRPGPLDIGVAARLRPLLTILLGTTGLMLLAVCTNLANLVLLRSTKHDREVAVLMALGAGRRRVAVRVLAECGVLTALGLLVALGVAAFGVQLLPALLPPSPLPLSLNAELNLRVLVFSGLLGVATTVLFSVGPALRAIRGTPAGALRTGPTGLRRPSHQSSALIAVQLGLSLAILVTSGFFFDRLDRLSRVDRGFAKPESVFLFPTDLSETELRTAAADGSLDRFVETVRRLPRVDGASLSSFVPLGFTGHTYLSVDVAGESRVGNAPIRYLANRVGEGYFELMGVPIRFGRALDQSDRAESMTSVVVNEAFVREHWPRSDPIGRGFRLGGRDVVVVGVAGDGKYRFDEIDEPAPPFVYLAWDQWSPVSPTLHVRSNDAGAFAPAVRREFGESFPDGVLSGPMSLDEYTRTPLIPVRLGASVLAGLGLLALAIAAIGLYATIAFRIAQRTSEVGVRMAVGAQRREILGMFLREGASTIVLGLGIGLPLAYGAQRVLQGAVPQLEAGSIAYPAAAAALFLVSLVATAIAARRASLILPIDALRAD